MTMDVSGKQFEFVAAIDPKRDATGELVEFMPQSRYRNRMNLPLNKHGRSFL